MTDTNSRKALVQGIINEFGSKNLPVLPGITDVYKYGLVITRGHDPNDKRKLDHYYNLAYDVASAANNYHTLKFYNWMKDNKWDLWRLGITRVLLGTLKPHVHISFNPDKLNPDGSIYFGYEKPDSSGLPIATQEFPGSSKINEMYSNKEKHVAVVDYQGNPFLKWWNSLSFYDKVKIGIAAGAGLIILPYAFKYFKKFKD